MTTQNTSFSTAKAGTAKGLALPLTPQHLAQYILCAGLGLLGGAAGVAVTILLVILAKLVLSAAVIFSPGIVLSALVATATGLAISWLFGFGAHRLLPNLFYSTQSQGLPVVFVFSVLASLLESILFLGSL